MRVHAVGRRRLPRLYLGPPGTCSGGVAQCSRRNPNFEVPADRPHFAIWPRRLPHALIAARDLAVVQRSRSPRARFPDKAAYVFFGREPDLSPVARRRPRRSPAGCRRRACRRGDRVAVFMQNCPQFPVALYAHPARQCRRRAGQPDEPGRGVQALHHRSRTPRSSICSADLAGIVATAQRSAAANRSALARVLVTRYTDAMPDGAIAEADAPPPAMDALAARPTRRCRPATSRWTDALAAGHRARPAHGTARRPRAAALHLGHDRPAQGLHAHAPHADAQRRRRRSGAMPAAGDGGARRRADVPHHRHALQRARLGVSRARPWS